MAIPALLRRQVISRAKNRCEFCGLSQAGQEASFHVDHVIPQTVGGKTVLENLALACVSCSLRKGAQQTAPDPQSGQVIALFNPRQDPWIKHFAWDGTRVVGLTPSGRATVGALKMNRTLALAIRHEESIHHRHPP